MDIENPDRLPTSSTLNGRCPACGYRSNFTSRTTLTLSPNVNLNPQQAETRVAAITCLGCGQGTAVIEKRVSATDDTGTTSTWFEGVSWWPMPNMTFTNSGAIPDSIRSTFEEGGRCVTVNAPHAAVAMFRNAVAAIVDDKGSEAATKKYNLNDKIDQMAADHTLFDDFADWAHSVRLVGNAGAHQESYNAITLDEAIALQEFTRELIEFLYVQPARRAKVKPPTKTPKPKP